MIIDFRVTAPPAEWVQDTQWELPDHLKNYARTYRKAGETLNLYQNAAELVSAMNSSGVDKAILQAEWAFGDYRALNKAVARIVQSYPDLLIGYATVNPAEDDDMVKVVEAAVMDMGMRGINLQPFAYRLRANDKRFYPVYAKCLELGIPVTIHTSINFSSDRSIDYGRPLYVDEVASDFPELTIIANHGGWPWVLELIAVAWKHPNVYIEYGAISPRYMIPGTGWDALVQYGNTLLQDKILFATDSMLSFKRVIDETRELPLNEETKQKWLGGNAARLLKP